MLVTLRDLDALCHNAAALDTVTVVNRRLDHGARPDPRLFWNSTEDVDKTAVKEVGHECYERNWPKEGAYAHKEQTILRIVDFGSRLEVDKSKAFRVEIRAQNERNQETDEIEVNEHEIILRLVQSE